MRPEPNIRILKRSIALLFGLCRKQLACFVLAAIAPMLLAQPLTTGEKEMLGQMRLAQPPALVYLSDLRLMLNIEQDVSRALLLDRCEKRSIYKAIDRLGNPTYVALVNKTTASVTHLHNSVDRYPLLTDDEIAALALYRASDAQRKVLVKADLRNLMMREENNAALLSDSLLSFDDVATDTLTGKRWPQWPQWLGEYSRRAHLFDALVSNLNKADSGLGDAFTDLISDTNTSTSQLTSAATTIDFHSRLAKAMARMPPLIAKDNTNIVKTVAITPTAIHTLEKIDAAKAFLQKLRYAKQRELLESLISPAECGEKGQVDAACETKVNVKKASTVSKDEGSLRRNLSSKEVAELKKIYGNREAAQAPVIEEMFDLVRQNVRGACETLM